MSQPPPSSERAAPSSLVLLDACALINLYACGYASEILDELETFGIVSHVQRESLFIRQGGTGEDARDRVSIDLESTCLKDCFRLYRTRVKRN